MKLQEEEGWSLKEKLNIPEDDDVPYVFLAFIEARAVHDFHHGCIDNGYQAGTPEHEAYSKKIIEMRRKKGDWV